MRARSQEGKVPDSSRTPRPKQSASERAGDARESVEAQSDVVWGERRQRGSKAAKSIRLQFTHLIDNGL